MNHRIGAVEFGSSTKPGAAATALRNAARGVPCLGAKEVAARRVLVAPTTSPEPGSSGTIGGGDARNGPVIS